jgi:hypothetical protein
MLRLEKIKLVPPIKSALPATSIGEARKGTAYFYNVFTFPKARGCDLTAETSPRLVADLLDSWIGRCEAWIACDKQCLLPGSWRGGLTRIYDPRRRAGRVCLVEPKIGDF